MSNKERQLSNVQKLGKKKTALEVVSSKLQTKRFSQLIKSV